MTQAGLITLIALIFSLFEVFIIVNFFRQKRYRFFIENIIIFLKVLLFFYFIFKSKLQIHTFIISFFVISIFGHTFLGQYLNIYNKSKYYDRFLHLMGTFSYSLFTYSIINNILRPINYPKFYVTLFVITIGITIGAMFEIFEFAQDTFLKTKNQHGLKDTNFDLISDVLGSIIAGISSIFVFS